MSQSVRAIYDNGALRLLDEVELSEGQEVYVEILSEKERVRAALGDLLVNRRERPDLEGIEIDEEALFAEIAEAFKGLPPISDEIIAERRSGF